MYPARWSRLATAFLCALALLTSGCATGHQRTLGEHIMLYASVGAELTWYDVDANAATLVHRGSVALPANIQYAWAHPSRQFLYVAWCDAPGSTGGTHHGISAFAINRQSGALTAHGADAALRTRPIHLTGDIPGTHILAAHNDPSGVTVLALAPDGTIGREVVPAAPLDLGTYAHQVRVDPSDTIVYVVTRGIALTPTSPERPGAIKVLHYTQGALTMDRSIAPGGGYAFQSRNIDFHPTRPWVYLVLEQQNALQLFDKDRNGSLAAMPRYSTSTLAVPSTMNPAQVAAAVAVHPGGRVAYVANRASSTRITRGTPVFAGGVNSIAVFALDSITGQPTRIADVPTLGFSPRTFTLDDRGRLLVVGNSVPMAVLDGDSVHTVPANLALFHIGADGRLTFARTYPVDTRPRRSLVWTGLVTLP